MGTPRTDPSLRQGAVSTARRADGAIQSDMSGHVDADVAQSMSDDVHRLMAARPNGPHIWLVDTRRVSGYSSDIGKVGTTIVSRFKKDGGPHSRMVVIVTSGTIRMMATTIAFASRMPMKIVSDVKDAEREVKTALAGATQAT